jgi:hypothetical protein
MTPYGRTPRDPGKDGAALSRQSEPTTPPSDVELLAALRTIAAWLGIGPTTPTIYTADRLPPDCASRDAYMRQHRVLRRAGVAGAYVRGKLLVCTAEAWATELPQTARKTSLTIVQPDALDAALGIRVRAAR